MREAAWNVELGFILAAQFDGEMLAEGRRLPTQVNSDVEHGATDDSHQLGLTECATLIMQSSEHTTGGFRLIVLDEMDWADLLFKLGLLE